MGLIDDKKNVFTTIGAYTSFMERSKNQKNDGTNLFPSINNKKDVVPYLLDVLKVVVGSDALKQLTGNLFVKFTDIAEPQIKETLKKQLIQHNSGSQLPNFFKTTGNGIDVPVKDIDVFGKLKTNPTSSAGSLLYGSTDTFDSKAYEAITLDGTPVEYNNVLITYNSATDKFNFKTTNASSSQNIGQWLGNYINNTIIIDKKEFLTNVMNGVYGSVTSNQNKTVEQVYNELQVSKLIDQLLQDDDSFEISQSDYDALLEKAQALVDGVVYYDMGCGIIGAKLPLDDMIDLIQQVSGSTDTFAVGNLIEGTIEKSTENIQDIQQENKETIKDGFFQRIIKMIQQILAQIITTSPQIRMLQAIISAFESPTGTPKIGDPKTDMKKFKIFIKCLIKDLMRMINQFIFELIVSFLIAMLVPIVKKLAQEKINQYVGILKSLIT
jgi:hypothetical protein